MKQAMIDSVKNPKTDRFHTPAYAVEPLLPYLRRTLKAYVIWEPTDPGGNGHITGEIQKAGYKVIATGLPKVDFLKQEPKGHYDMIVTNPPYSLKDEFLSRAYELDVPFAFLLPLTALEGVRRGALFSRYGLEVLVLDRRVEFTGKSVWFATAWFCRGILPRPLLFARLRKKEACHGASPC
jgi:hypothetical protein